MKLINLKIKGIKNLEEELIIDFINVKKTQELSKLKGIYGSNGSGKTAIIEAAKIVKMVLSESSWAKDQNVTNHLAKIINAKSNEFSTEVIFLKNGKRFEYFLTLKKENEEFIVYELLKVYAGFNSVKLVASFPTAKEIAIAKKLSNEININDFNITDDCHYRRLNSSQILNNFFTGSLLNSIKYTTKEVTSLREIITGVYSDFLIVYIGDDGTKDWANALTTNFLKNKAIVNVQKDNKIYTNSEIKEYEEYLNKKLLPLIKIFKPNIKQIKIETKLHSIKKKGKTYTITDHIFLYKDYAINFDYESLGVKRLTLLLQAYIKACNNETIIFIDELENHLQDSLIKSLVETFFINGKGQFIFTTHNINTMDVFQDYKIKKGINILINNKLETLTYSGNYSLKNIYASGYIENTKIITNYDISKVL